MKTHFTVVWALLLLVFSVAGVAAQDEGADAMEMPEAAAGSGEHPIGWIEFMFDDAAATQEFYGNVFGWTFQPFQEQYFFYMTPKGLGGGFNGFTPEEPLNGIIYMYTPDIAAKLAQIAAAGGTVVAEKEVVDPDSGGGVAFFKDPAGVMMGLADMETPQDYEPAPMAGSEGLVPGSIVAVELYGGDLDATGRFYKDLFGWETASSMPQYMMFNTGKGLGGVFQGHTPAAPVMVYIWVEDVAAALDAIDAAGGKRLGDAMQMPGMPTFGYFTDPAGKSIGLMGPGA